MNNWLETIKRYEWSTWNDKVGGTVGDYFSEDARIHSAIGEKEGAGFMQEVVDTWVGAIPDLEMRVEDYICDGERVVSRWVAEGTHRGELMGYAGTGKLLKYCGVTIYKFNEGGKICEYWAYVDRDGLKEQLRA